MDDPSWFFILLFGLGAGRTGSSIAVSTSATGPSLPTSPAMYSYFLFLFFRIELAGETRIPNRARARYPIPFGPVTASEPFVSPLSRVSPPSASSPLPVTPSSPAPIAVQVSGSSPPSFRLSILFAPLPPATVPAKISACCNCTVPLRCLKKYLQFGS